jgi:hypothetical protein
VGPRNLSSILDLDPAAAAIVGRYLAVLDSRISASRRAREQIVAEIADGLACAVAHEMERGVPADVAAQAAVAEYGDPAALAAAFARQLVPVAAHRIGIGLVSTGPLVGAAWVAAYASTGRDWPAQISAILSRAPAYPLVLFITVPAALVAITATGRAARRLAIPTSVTTGAAMTATLGCILGDLSLLGLALGRTSASIGLTMLAMGASLVRLTATGVAGHRLARLRAAGN